MSYKILEHEKAIKFKRKHKNDKQLILRIDKKYIEIIRNPHSSAFLELKSEKCPKCDSCVGGRHRL